MILDSDSYVLTQLELYSELNDTHAFGPYTAIFGSKRIPVVARMVEGRLIVTDSYKMNGVLPGDEIVKISGRTIPEVIARVKKYTAQSNESVLLGKVADYAFWTSKDSVNLTCLRESRQWQTTVPSRAISDVYQEMNKKDLLREPWRLLNDSVAYMYIGTFQAKDAPQVYEKIKDTKALIVDMRGYPSDHSIISEFFQPYFVPVPVPYVKMLVPLWNFPGLFYRSPISPLGKLEQEDVNDPNSWRLVENPNAYKGKLVILVDESTISASEHYTMILQAIPNSVTVGSQTAGADGDVVRIAMPGWMDVGFSSIKVLYPDGTDTQRVGVRVDHEVKPTVEGVITGRDEVLEYALQLINEI